jgi:phage recombination protein Bet
MSDEIIAHGETRALVVQNDDMRWLRVPPEEMQEVLRTSLYPGADPKMVSAVMAYCRAAGLNVMLRPVHIVPMWIPKKEVERDGRRVTVEGTNMMRDVIMPSINHYRVQAHRTGRYMGLSRPEWGPTEEFRYKGGSIRVPVSVAICARVRDADTGEIIEFWHEERFSECYSTSGRDTDEPNAMWKKRPTGQMAKTAEAGALRKAFPELGDVTAEEMEGKTIELVRDEDGTHKSAGEKRQPASASLDTFAGGSGEVKAGKVKPGAKRQHKPIQDAEIVEGNDPAEAGATTPDAAKSDVSDQSDTRGRGLPTEETGEVLKMPDAIAKDFTENGRWSKGWRWINENMPKLGPVGRQDMANEHAKLLYAVRGNNDAYKKAVNEFVVAMGVTVPAPEASA